MTRVVRFEKWEGLGNDFVLVRAETAAEVDRLAAAAPALCDRRRGIGADGVLSILREAGRAPRMIVINADGSRPEMCGNGLRCVAAHLAIHGGGHEGASMSVLTDAGERRCEVYAGGDTERLVAVGMGRASLGDPLVVDWGGVRRSFTTAFVGNPHAVSFAPFDEALVDALGPVVATRPLGGTNVEFCRELVPRDGRAVLEVVVWERGVGRTMACGTGACAVAAVACEEGRAPFDAPIAVRLPGGELTIVVSKLERALTMMGPARRVFSGEVVLP